MAFRNPFSCILVAYDGTPAASEIVSRSITLARALGAKLVVFGVVPPLSAECQAEGWGLETSRAFRPHLQAEMIRFAEYAKTLQVEIATEIVDGDPDKSIETRARSVDIDLVVVGHRNLTRVHRWFEGRSTAEDLINRTSASVLVIPEPDEAE